ncbi:hypothetical protein JNB88_19225 [Rhizobium cauense]|uniref:hypothetical protein n=1 Tax=Rhizobium cauense TaxID=1166683 RepID=UPI001C6E02A4|nr:hypothetical protein [Rhizobium cauense]MBW9115769.1 hypothetical protein [Rhizobium cauense]
MSIFFIVASTSALSANPLIGDKKLAVAKSVATTKRMAAFPRKHDSIIQLRTDNLPNMAKFALKNDRQRPIGE